MHVSAERGFLPSSDPLRRLSLSRNGPAAAEWEAALDDLPKLAVAAGGDGARAASSNVAGSSASVGGDRGVGGSSTCVLRRALLALPPFPLEQLLQQEQEQKGFQAGRGESGGGDSGNAAGVDGTLLESGGSPELWRAYQMLSFLSHAFMWCEPGPPPASLPAVLAVPWVAVARRLGMPPVLTYSTYNLYNWRRLDPAAPVRLGNIVCLHNFLGGPDEEWFRLVHVDIEARAGGAVAALPDMQRAAARGDAGAVLRGLQEVSGALKEMQTTLGRMGEKCDPYIYYQRVRQPMSGWRNNPQLPQGLVYEGVSDKPVQLYGETGAQSSILHAFDAALGIEHEQVWLRDYLSSMVEHMPPPHRAFLARLAAANRYQPPTAAAAGSNDPLPAVANVRTFVQTYTGAPAVAAAGAAVATAGVGGGLQASAGQGELRDAYNAAVEELERFRSQHKAFANAYIARWAKKETTGTGGSDFMPALAGYRDTTARHFVQ